MHEAPLDLARSRILISNDDGINATGLAVLERIARSLSDDVWVVAPTTEQSGASHSLTLHTPLRVRQVDERRFSVAGTPTDCVLFAVRQILGEHPPDLVLSGVNRGGNLGDDVTYSGTIAAAMEGALLGIRSIALSQLIDGPHKAKWATAEAHAPEIIRRAVEPSWPAEMLLNVNFPDIEPDAVTGIDVVPQGRRKIGVQFEKRRDPRGIPYFWFGRQRDEPEVGYKTDLSAVRAGAVTVTPLHLDLTYQSELERFQAAFD
ncbi:MAG: 5'/3'-nucleotidase SurE [Alphaproteobacteria bacterium]|nr:5'/3'-nucleotidase SurE [Alphaproteobacteria bacterium]